MHIAKLDASAYTVPTDQPEADGTFEWQSTTLVLCRAESDAGESGLGFTYCAPAAAQLIAETLAPAVSGSDVDDVGFAWQRMLDAVRNIGRAGVAACAISAVDVALWDLKARSLQLPVFRLLSPYRTSTPVYGSGGFTSYTLEDLAEQLGEWSRQGMRMVKMKVGKDWGVSPDEDVDRVAMARDAIGSATELFVDANGAYTPKQAVSQSVRFAEYGVTYFEEPVSSDHLDQMTYVREAVPMDVAAGEYGYDHFYFRRMLQSGAVDILQADVTRCLGITGFLAAGGLANDFATRFSAHTAPSIHAHAACGVPRIEHVEYFHDHARIERMLFGGFQEPVDGAISPDPSAPGLGLEFKEADARQWQVWP